MTKITSEKKKGFQGRPYTKYTLKLEQSVLTFNAEEHGHPEDLGYVLFDLKSEGEPNSIETYFGMDRKLVRKFARKLLEITV